MQLPVARSIPMFPAIAADQSNSCLLNTPPLPDMVLKQNNLCRFVIFAGMVILVHRNLDKIPRFHSEKSITACPAIVSADVQKALQACAALNVFGKYPGKRMGMLDSGCNELIIKLDDESRAYACEWSRDDVTVGDAAAGTFTTDVTAIMYIGVEFTDLQGQNCQLVAQTPVTPCAQFNWDLFPTRWFQNAGHTIVFEGTD
jgi:hypothetical protein